MRSPRARSVPGSCRTGRSERLRDLISVCEFRAHEFTPESAVRFLKDSGFFDEYIMVGVKRGNGWRRSVVSRHLKEDPAMRQPSWDIWRSILERATG
jgi:hypothetical protein